MAGTAGRLMGLVLLGACGRLNYDPTELEDAGIVDTSVIVDQAMCSEAPCRLLNPQCGCGTGQMCQRTGDTTETRGCVAAGTIAADGVCPLDRECVEGHGCLAQSPTVGRCHAYCDDDTDCATGLECARYDEGVGIGFCGSACTLAGGCPAGAACKVVITFDFDTAGPAAIPVCADPTGVPIGGTCSGFDCVAGAFCDDGGVCRAFCRFDGTLNCSSGTCTAPLAPIRLGNVLHGFCR